MSHKVRKEVSKKRKCEAKEKGPASLASDTERQTLSLVSIALIAYSRGVSAIIVMMVSMLSCLNEAQHVLLVYFF